MINDDEKVCAEASNKKNCFTKDFLALSQLRIVFSDVKYI